MSQIKSPVKSLRQLKLAGAVHARGNRCFFGICHRTKVSGLTMARACRQANSLENSIVSTGYFQWSGDLERPRLERSEGAAHAGLSPALGPQIRTVPIAGSLPPTLGMAYTTPAVSKFCRRLQLCPGWRFCVECRHHERLKKGTLGDRGRCGLRAAR